MENYFRSLATIIDAEFEASNLIKHKGKKGTAREHIISKYLSKLLPEKFGIGKGEIRSCTGVTSPDCDLIIYDKLNCPIIYNEEETQIFPIESVYAIIEAKSVIKKADIKKFCNTLADLRNYKKFQRSFPKKIRETYPYGNIFSDVDSEPAGFLMAKEGFKLDSLQKFLLKYYKENGPVNYDYTNNIRINATCLINQGIITHISKYTSEEKVIQVIDPISYRGSSDLYLEAIHSNEDWFRLFFSSIYSVIMYSTLRVSPPAFLNYLQIQMDIIPSSINKLPREWPPKITQ